MGLIIDTIYCGAADYTGKLLGEKQKIFLIEFVIELHRYPLSKSWITLY